jgi:hypothetical protein
MNFAALFLQNLSITDENLKAGLFAVLGALFLIFVFAFIALYIYLSFVFILKYPPVYRYIFICQEDIRFISAPIFVRRFSRFS